jgi:hypothetical protein
MVWAVEPRHVFGGCVHVLFIGLRFHFLRAVPEIFEEDFTNKREPRQVGVNGKVRGVYEGRAFDGPADEAGHGGPDMCVKVSLGVMFILGHVKE